MTDGAPGAFPVDVRDPLERERWLRQRLDRDPEQDERVVIPGRAVQAKRVAARAPMHQDPFPAAPHADGDRLHERAAVGVSVPGGVIVEMTAPQAVRAVVAMSRAERVRRHVQPTVAAPE